MEALASVHSIQSVMLPRGKLSVHEEFPDFVAEAIEPFLLDRSRMKNPGCAPRQKSIAHVRFRSKADFSESQTDVRFTSKSGHH